MKKSDLARSVLIAVVAVGVGIVIGRGYRAPETAGADSGTEERTTRPDQGRQVGAPEPFRAGPGRIAPKDTLVPTRDFTRMADAFESVTELARLRDWIDLIDDMGPEDALAIANLLEEKSAQGRDFGLFNKLFWQRWAEVDGQAAWDYISAKGEGYERDVDHFFKSWYVADPALSAATVAELFEAPIARKALEGLLHGWAESDPDGSVGFATTRLDAESQVQAAVHIGGSVIQQMGLDEAKAWYDRQRKDQAPAFDTEIARVFYFSLGQRNWDDALAFASENVNQPWAGNEREQVWVAQMAARSGHSPWDYVGQLAGRPDMDEENTYTVARKVLHDRQAIGQLAEWLSANPNHAASAALTRALVERAKK